MNKMVLPVFLLMLAGPAWAQGHHQLVIGEDGSFRPRYSVHIIPDFTDQGGKPIYKGIVESTDVNQICAGKGAYKNIHHAGGTYSQNHRTSQNPETKKLVMEQSGVPWADRAHYEDDHYGPLSLGFSNSIENRWAQPRFGEWNAGKKDRMENYAQEQVCDGKLDLKEAQSWFQTKIMPDWRVPYCRLVTAGDLPADPDCKEIKF